MLLGSLFLVAGLLGVLALARVYRFIAWPLLTAFAARALFVLADEFVLGLSMSGSGDGFWWDADARVLAARGIGTIWEYAEPGHKLYKCFMAALYYVFGASHIMVQMINAFLGTLVVLVVWRLALLLSDDVGPAKHAAWAIAVFPSAILHSGLLLREVAVTLPLVFGVYQLAAWHRSRRLRPALLAASSLLVSMAFHSGAFAVLVALFVWLTASWARSMLIGRTRNFWRSTAMVIVAGATLAFVSNTGWGMSKFSNLDTDDVSTIRAAAAVGRATYLHDMQPQTPTELALQTPLRVVYFLFAPFPWMLSGLRDMVGFVDAIFFLWLVSRVVRRRRFVLARPAALLVAAVFLVLAMTFAVGVSNYGTAFRHRSKMLPILVAVAAVLPRRRSAGVAVREDTHRGAVGPYPRTRLASS